MNCAVLAAAEQLPFAHRHLTADDMATLGMILRTNGLSKLRIINLRGNVVGDAGVQALCEGLCRGRASLRSLVLDENGFGPAGAHARVRVLLPRIDHGRFCFHHGRYHCGTRGAGLH